MHRPTPAQATANQAENENRSQSRLKRPLNAALSG
jgi:hypothetical protein